MTNAKNQVQDLFTHAADSAGADAQASDIGKMLLQESDRGCAIFGACILDDELERLLRSSFRNDAQAVKQTVDSLFEGEAPLATFSARIKLAFAMHLITSKMQRQLDLIRRLRNDFAHEAGPIDFNDRRCRDRYNIIIAKMKQFLPPTEDHPKTKDVLRRVGFILAISALAGSIRAIRENLPRIKDVKTMIATLEEKEA